LIPYETLEYNDGVQRLTKGQEIKELFVFLSVFALFLIAAQGFLNLVSSTFGLPPSLFERLSFDNELLVQVVGLFLAIFALRFVSSPRPKEWRQWARFESFGKGVFVSREDFGGRLYQSLFNGFLVASFLMALMSLLGHSTIERASWDWGSFFVALPRAVGQLAVLFLWIFARLLARSRLRQVLMGHFGRDGGDDLAARLLLIGFESVLLFRVFQSDEDMVARLVTYLVCALMAAAFQIWEEGVPAPLRLRRAWSLAGFETGLLVTLFHIYGFPRGMLRLESVFLVFPGPQADRWGWMAQGSLPSQFVFVAFMIFATYLLARRALRRRSNRLIY